VSDTSDTGGYFIHGRLPRYDPANLHKPLLPAKSHGSLDADIIIKNAPTYSIIKEHRGTILVEKKVKERTFSFSSSVRIMCQKGNDDG
jgi:hypothetical protein